MELLHQIRNRSETEPEVDEEPGQAWLVSPEPGLGMTGASAVGEERG